MDARAIKEGLALEPHPEGGYYRQTWADSHGSAIYFLLEGDEWTTWHRVRDRVEIWHFYVGAPVQLDIEPNRPGAESTQTITLGTDLRGGQQPQAVVPPSAWQRARSSGPWSLVGCTVTPPFSFETFELAR